MLSLLRPQAARKFVEVVPELGSSFDGVVAPEDIAVYGGLCALATFSREEMKRKVLDNSSFKNFLDLVPQVFIVKPIDGKNRQYKPSVTTGGKRARSSTCHGLGLCRAPATCY